MLIALVPMAALAAPNVEFDMGLLHGAGSGLLDPNRFDLTSAQPGTYSAEILLNGSLVGRLDIELALDEHGQVRPCVEPGLFDLVGLDAGKLDVARADAIEGELLPLPEQRSCLPISRYVPEASMSFDAGEQILEVSVPQLYLVRTRDGWVDPASWDKGVNAGLLNYHVSHSRYQGRGQHQQSTSASINAGLNLGAWRVRHDGYFSQGGSGGSHYQASRSYAQREIRSLNSQLTVGEAATAGDLFDGVNFTGVSLQSDPRMLPEVMGSYAPVVRGVAQTNARVTVSQRGYVIHETNVAPGPFEIDDLRNTSSSGDLEVEIIEADGRVERFIVPYAAVPKLLRQGQQRNSLTVGTLRDNSLSDAPRFAEATLRRGVSSQVTLYGGGIVAEDYTAALLGAAVNTRFGAFSGDVTFSDARLPGELPGVGSRARGQSYRLTYSRSFNTATSFSLAAYRYSTEGFLSLRDAARLQEQLGNGGGDTTFGRQRSRLDLTLSHRLPKGSLFGNASTVDYWSQGRRTTNFSVGYSGQWRSASYSISARRTLESSLFERGQRQSTGAYLSISMPLGSAPRSPRLSANVSGDGNDQQYRAGISGQFSEGHQGQYNAYVSQGHGRRELGAGVNYETSVASLGASFNQGGGSRQLSANASGGVIVHGGGLVLSQSLGETVALVHVPEAPGAGISHLRGVKTNKRGFAVVPYVNAYRRNEVAVDPTGLPMDIELKSGSVNVVPTAGAVVLATVPTVNGRSALLEVQRPDAAPLPFGADVTTLTGEVVGVVGQGNRLWVRGIDESGHLLAKLDAEGNECRILYDLNSDTQDGLLKVHCAEGLPSERVLAGGAAKPAHGP